jgi:hypothetical protein
VEADDLESIEGLGALDVVDTDAAEREVSEEGARQREVEDEALPMMANLDVQILDSVGLQTMEGFSLEKLAIHYRLPEKLQCLI